MKQHTTPDQTAKLIELGFPHPRIDAGVTKWEGYEPICTGSYTLGELIAILPQTINDFYDLSILSSRKGWWVLYGMIGDGDMWLIEHEVYSNDLIDALYNMIVELKEKGAL